MVGEVMNVEDMRSEDETKVFGWNTLLINRDTT